MKLRSVLLGVALTSVAGLALAAPPAPAPAATPAPAKAMPHHVKHRKHHRHHAHKAAVRKPAAPVKADASNG